MAMNTYDDIWLAVLDYCKTQISKTGFSLWIEPLKLIDFNGNTITLLLASPMQEKITKSQYGTLLEQAFEEVLGFKVNLEYKLCTEQEAQIKAEEEEHIKEEKEENYPFTFDTFIEGPSNRFAYRAAIAVSENPGGQFNQNHSYNNYNPLFIYGKPGLGKTHILNAICYQIRKNFPEMKILYVRAEDFANEFVNALQHKTTDSFHNKFRNADVLLIDDIQFIAGKEATEEEFFHTFNTLVENGKQIVLTSDRPPKEIQSLTERLCGRFESGLLADIQPPEFETRCAIIKNKAQLLNFQISNDVVDFIAEKIKSNIRQLEGTTKKLYAMCKITGHNPTTALAQKVIKDVIDNEVPPTSVTVNRIIEEVSRTEGVSEEDIKSSKQKANISHARKMCMYIIREATTLTYEMIGKEFKKNYSTVIYSIKEMEKEIQNDSKMQRKVSDIINNIKTE